MSKTLRFVCSGIPSPFPKWANYRRGKRVYTCTAQLSAVPLQIREKVQLGESAEAFTAIGFVNPKNFLIDEDK